MKVSIGILAYNEEENIAATIASLAEQDLLEDPEHEVEIHCVPNGCRDGTAGCATAAFSALEVRHPRVFTRVDVVEAPGKANAWNQYVHSFSSPNADALLLLDADIRFGQPECLRLVVEALARHPEAVVAVDTPLKDIAAKTDPSLRDKVSLAASNLQRAGAPKIAGSLYCARSHALRDIEMPIGLLVEDGFLKAMLLTKSFREPENLSGIVRAEGATHFFTAVGDFNGWFQHERRLVNGTAMNIVLFEFLREQVASGGNAREQIRQRNASNPGWVAELVKERLRGRLPGGLEFVSAPLVQLGRLPLAKRLGALPVASLRAVLNAGVAWVCLGDLRAGRLRW